MGTIRIEGYLFKRGKNAFRVWNRRCCFEIISPTNSHVLQADTEDLFKNWIQSLQQGISTALHETINSKETAKSEPEPIGWEDSDEEPERRGMKPNANQILLIPGNEKCCDCGAPNPD